MHGTIPSDSSQIEWTTPKGDKKFGRTNLTLNKLIKEFDLKLDPCATALNTMCKYYYTKQQDGLKQIWNKNFIFNPPFAEPKLDSKTHKPIFRYDKKKKEMVPAYKSVIGKWVEKAIQEAISNKVVGIGILPVYTSLDWYHNYILDIASIIWLRGRMRYGGGKGSPNFDTMICIWDGRKNKK